jgi:hypothetical protein
MIFKLCRYGYLPAMKRQSGAMDREEPKDEIGSRAWSARRGVAYRSDVMHQSL